MRKRRLLPLIFLILLVILTVAPGGRTQDQAPAAGAAGGEMTEGEVRKVDAENGKLTIRHGEIKNLGMPPMTMVFQVRDKVWLEGLQRGSRIRFQAVEEGGKYVVTALESSP